MTKGQRLITLLLIGIFTLGGAIVGSKIVMARSSQDQASRAMSVPGAQKWEYLLVITNADPEQAQAKANSLGEQGYEMVNFSDSKYNYQFVFKRPKSK